MICAEGLQSPARMMIDTDAGRNLIKQNSVNPDLPIDQNGVLGSEFFRENKVNINYLSKCLEIQNELYLFETTHILTIPAKTVTKFYIPIKNTEKSEGYEPRLHIGEGINAGDAIVENCNGKAYIKFANTNEITKQVDELLKNKKMKPSQSPYNTPVWIVPEKPDSKGKLKWRMVLDFRKLNEKTIRDSYSQPNINDMLDSLGSARYFSVFDLATGFHHIKMDPKDSNKTAFSTHHGHYEFDRMPFGSKSAPATFQRLMDITLTGLIGTELFVYLDDLVIFADTLEEHK